MSDVHLAPAEVSSASEATSLIYQTDPAVWDYLFGAGSGVFESFISGLWRLPQNSYAYTEATGLYKQDPTNNLCGLELGYIGAKEAAFTASANSAAIDFIPESALNRVLENAHDIEYLTPTMPDQAYYIHFLSVDPTYAGKGLGRRLLENCFEKARAQNCQSIHLDVYTDNPAVDLYKAFGFRIAVESCFPVKIGLPNHYRMIKDL